MEDKDGKRKAPPAPPSDPAEAARKLRAKRAMAEKEKADDADHLANDVQEKLGFGPLPDTACGTVVSARSEGRTGWMRARAVNS